MQETNPCLGVTTLFPLWSGVLFCLQHRDFSPITMFDLLLRFTGSHFIDAMLQSVCDTT